ncbi:hypothetical protein BGZ96_009200 [Linnemannia gamsii]|uniref:Uncharacterized protein n=1 Tax=Linnemannia gamsii TaxID=64522 RepID=A0ABQ7JYQ6_9FUNG|nr:hypothetical protein BGZ96_009200 [Linnemannia gamsii]
MLPHVLTRPATMLATLLLTTLLILPIPSRAENQVQFPASSSSCIACQPAFSTPSCQTILDSIASQSSSSLSNSTLANCQCSGTFLSLYSSCVKCFTETNQVSLVFGSSQAPAQSSLEAYCKAVPASVKNGGGKNPTITITRTTTSTVPVEPTGEPNRPSSAMSLTQSGVLGYHVVMAVAFLAFFFSSLP